jgi:hypothetical protein
LLRDGGFGLITSMYCYQHNDQHALGLCKHCSKAVCKTCLIDTKNGLACSEYCAAEVATSYQMTERAKRIYGLSGKKSRISNGVMFYLVVGLFFIAGGIYPFFTGGDVGWFITLLGVIMFGFGVSLHLKMRDVLK